MQLALTVYLVLLPSQRVNAKVGRAFLVPFSLSVLLWILSYRKGPSTVLYEWRERERECESVCMGGERDPERELKEVNKECISDGDS